MFCFVLPFSFSLHPSIHPSIHHLTDTLSRGSRLYLKQARTGKRTNDRRVRDGHDMCLPFPPYFISIFRSSAIFKLTHTLPVVETLRLHCEQNKQTNIFCFFFFVVFACRTSPRRLLINHLSMRLSPACAITLRARVLPGNAWYSLAFEVFPATRCVAKKLVRRSRTRARRRDRFETSER